MLLHTDKSPQKLSSKNRKTSLFRLVFFVLLALITTAAVYFFFPSFLQKNSTEQNVIFCDAEKTSENKFITKGFLFGNGQTQSQEAAFSGKNACKLAGKQKFGITYTLQNPEAGSRYKVSVWRKRKQEKDGYLAISGSGDSKYYAQEELGKNRNSAGWEMLEAIVRVPKIKPPKELKVYVYITGNEAVYFDDLRIAELDKSDLSNDYNPELFNLDIENKDFNKIIEKRKEALRTGLLVSEDDDWVKGKIRTETKDLIVDLRLKGDWLDHLKGDKWSYRIKVKDPNAWNRLKTFSIQNPATRDFLKEWLFHKLLERENVLTPRYDFLELVLNNKSYGIYAYEEHFDKQLVEFKKRREGPILKFNEDGLWNIRKRERNNKDLKGASFEKYFHTFDAANIEVFKQGKTLKSPVLSQQFELAHRLMFQYKNGLKTASEIFDIELLAKYYALADLTGGHHGIIWHNQRFYYNPLSGKLEPIGYDGFGAGKSWVYHPFLGYSAFNEDYNGEAIYKHLFTDENFITTYIQYLNEFTKPTYLRHFFAEVGEEMTQRQAFLQDEFPNYQFDKKEWIDNAKKINHLLLPYDEMSLQAYRQEKNETKQRLQVYNYHFLPLEIVGFGKKKTEISDSLTQKISLLQARRPEHLPKYIEIDAPKKAKYVFFRVPGLPNKTFASEIKKIVAPNASATPIQSLFAKNKTLQSNEIYQINGKTVFFAAGKHEITKDIIIPKGYQVHFAADAQLNFTNGAKFVSRSPVFTFGTSDSPVLIYSSDKSAAGFTVLQTAETSTLRHTVFRDFDTLKDNGWILTGAVTFYDADVNMSFCTFAKNHCEDGLNIVSSVFDIDNIVISETFSDGFDADFCEGTIRNAQFIATGNDGMDFSGSIIKIENCDIQNAGDKGISVGEQATVTIKSASIDGAVIGVASKDLSKLTIEKIDLKNLTQGFAAYQKKPEYGGSTIIAKSYSAENVKFLHQIEQDSRLKLEGTWIEGE
ncbi:MAG: CotH kinase family protein [Chitinophagales bacterium]